MPTLTPDELAAPRLALLGTTNLLHAPKRGHQPQQGKLGPTACGVTGYPFPSRSNLRMFNAASLTVCKRCAHSVIKDWNEGRRAAQSGLDGDARDVFRRLVEGWHGTLAELVEMAQAVAGVTPEPVVAGSLADWLEAGDLAGELADVMRSQSLAVAVRPTSLAAECECCGVLMDEPAEAGATCAACLADLAVA